MREIAVAVGQVFGNRTHVWQLRRETYRALTGWRGSIDRTELSVQLERNEVLLWLVAIYDRHVRRQHDAGNTRSRRIRKPTWGGRESYNPQRIKRNNVYKLFIEAVPYLDRAAIERLAGHLDDFEWFKAAAQPAGGRPKVGPVDNKAQLKSIPMFDAKSTQWVKNKTAANIEEVGVDTLADYRLASNGGIVADDGMRGIDRDGRMWRKVGTKRSHPRYLLTSLKKKPRTHTS
ncbi:MAG: hypothetical protein HY718_04125 [Planctomycetes bacterium]|nr:hypothetical protein [Planctomycetota bacterium]